ncbi:MAG TPA: NYN domain-containing protein [Sediminispirochaeta sp.]|nr:NYN domain-containing protein [Sediminispirochaeta sp.]
MANATILWDIENVTPKNDTKFIANLFDFLEEENRISSASCFGDWTRPNLKKIPSRLSDYNFELIHVPKSRKNSADISLITHATEMIFLYPHLQRYILITGDADFRPLLTTLKKHGKEVWIICDASTASEDLLAQSDRYYDYRSIMSKDYEEEPEEDSNETISKEAAYQLFYEAVDMMIKQKKKPSPGSVKVKMKLLNEDFKESQLGYRSWKAFLTDAIAHTNVEYDTDNSNLLTITEKDRKATSGNIPEVFRHLLSTLSSSSWTPFTKSSQALRDKNISIKRYGYNKFKKLVFDAEKRGLVETKNEGLHWFLKKKD